MLSPMRACTGRFMSVRMDMPHERLQEFGVVDYANSMMILAIVEGDSKETIAAIGQYEINEKVHTAEVALVVKDEYQNNGRRPRSAHLPHPSGQEAGAAGIHC